MNLFYCPDISGDQITLPTDEAHHIFHVMRLKENDGISITDGKGQMLTARLTEVSKKTVSAEIVESVIISPRKFSLHIAIAPTKNIDRFEWFLEKTTEIGVESITPLLCQRSERKEVKHERLEKVIVSAAKQSQKAIFPLLKPLSSFKEFISAKFNGHQLIAHCMNDEKVSFQVLAEQKNDLTVLIGPEGDFSSSELEMALENGFKSLSMGDSRLRTETAGVMSAAAFSLYTS